MQISHILCAGALLLAAGVAQSPTLDVRGGSFPGSLDLRVGPCPLGRVAMIVFSANGGPSPLPPPDPRVLNVGYELLGLNLNGVVTTPGGAFTPPPIAVPNDPGFRDAVLHWQAVTLPGTNGLIDAITPWRVTRFSPANAFRDRGTQFGFPRAFFPVIPTTPAQTSWLLIGGGSGGLLAQIAEKTTEIYDPATDTFVMGQDMTTPRSLHTVTALLDGRSLVVAGVDNLNDPQDSAELYDPATGGFTATGAMQDKRMGHSAIRLPDGRVMVAGGLSDLNAPTTPIDPLYSALTSIEIWNPATGVWTRSAASLRHPRAGHAAILRPDGKVLIAGGIGFTTILSIKIPAIFRETDLYDPVTDTIVAGPSMATTRAIFSFPEITPGRWLASGGIATISLTQYGTPTAAAEVYDAATNSWSGAGQMAHARGMHTAFALGNGRWLHIGGADGPIFTPNALGTTEIYDDATRTWTLGPAMSASRAGFGAFVTPTGQLHLLGGGTGPGASVVDTTDWFYR